MHFNNESFSSTQINIFRPILSILDKTNDAAITICMYGRLNRTLSRLAEIKTTKIYRNL